MTRPGRMSQSAFVMLTLVLSVLFTALSIPRAPVYKAEIQFQIAARTSASRPDLEAERRLILSDSLLNQVLKNNHGAVSTTNFRGFNLGADNKAGDGQTSIDDFRRHLKVIAYPENSAMLLQYKGFDGAETRKLLENLFQTYTEWRQPAGNTGFDGAVVNADRDLTQKKNNFLQSQSDFFNAVSRVSKDQKSQIALTFRQHEMTAKIEALKLRYGMKHPAMIEALRQKQVLDSQMAQTPGPGQISLLKDKMDNDFRVLDLAMKESAILAQQKTAVQSPYKILPAGDVEIHIVPQNIGLKLILAALLALIFSFAYLKIRERFSQVYESPDAVSRDFSHPVFYVPQIMLRRKEAGDFPAGAAFDALKALRYEIKLKGTDENPVKLLTITAGETDTGCGELATDLGRMAARAGEKVLILDADLRKPDLQRILPALATRNLVDYLSGQSRVDDIIIRTDLSGAHAVYAASVPNTSLDLLSSEKMKNFLISVREVYDLVLVLAPAGIKGPDAKVLSVISDQTLYVMKTDGTPKSEAKKYIPAFVSEKLMIVLIS